MQADPNSYARPFPYCHRLPGHFGGAYGNCKWKDHATRCSVRDGGPPPGGSAGRTTPALTGRAALAGSSRGTRLLGGVENPININNDDEGEGEGGEGGSGGSPNNPIVL